MKSQIFELVLEEIYIEGFRSIVQPFSYRLDTPGINIIGGKNGVGKTTILSALTWCFYGKTLKKKSNPEPYKFVMGKKYQGTLVKITAKVNGQRYTFFRTHKFKGDFGLGRDTTMIAIFTNNEFLKGIRDLTDGKKKVEEIIGHSYDLFINTILFGQKLKRLIQETGPTRNRVLEEAFDVVFIREGQKIAGDRLTLAMKEKEALEGHILSLNKDIENLKTLKVSKVQMKNQLVEQIEALRKEAEEAKEKDLAELKTKIEGYRKKIKKLDEAIDHGIKYTNQYNDLRNTAFKKELEIENLKGEMDDLVRITKEERPDRTQKKCPTCGNITRMDAQRYKDIMAVWRRKVERAVKEKKILAGQVKIKENILADLKRRMEYNRNKSAKIDSYQSERKMLGVYLNKALEEHRSLKEKKNDTKALKDLVSMVEGLKDDLRQKIKPELQMKRSERKGIQLELNQCLEKYNDLQWVYKEALSNKGLKAYVFHEKIKMLNRILMDYAEVLGYQIVFSVNLDSKSKEFTTKIFKGNHVRDYEDLSGGQQQLVDVGTAFAFHDAKESGFNCNMLAMDEIFEHLDDENVEVITELIRMKARTKSVHLITHLKEFNTAASNVLRLKLNKMEQTVVAGTL